MPKLAIATVDVTPGPAPPNGIVHSRWPSIAPSDTASPTRPSVPSKVRVCSATMRPVRATICVATRSWRCTRSWIGTTTFESAADDETLQLRRLLHPAVGDEGDVDDRVVAERVEQLERLCGTVDGVAGREVPTPTKVRARTVPSRARWPPGARAPRSRARRTPRPPRPGSASRGSGQRVPRSAGKRRARRHACRGLVGTTRVHGDRRGDPRRGEVRDVDPLVGGTAAHGGARRAVPRGRDRVRRRHDRVRERAGIRPRRGDVGRVPVEHDRGGEQTGEHQQHEQPAAGAGTGCPRTRCVVHTRLQKSSSSSSRRTRSRSSARASRRCCARSRRNCRASGSGSGSGPSRTRLRRPRHATIEHDQPQHALPDHHQRGLALVRVVDVDGALRRPELVGPPEALRVTRVAVGCGRAPVVVERLRRAAPRPRSDGP